MVSIFSILILALIPLVVVDGALKYSNCGSNNAQIKLNTLQILPHPIKIPSVPNFVLGVAISEDIIGPIKTVFKLSKKVLGINIAAPCENGVGSCTYPDWYEFCNTCPRPLIKGNVAMAMPMNVTSAVPTGTYVVQIDFTSATNQKGCVKIEGIEIKK